MLNLQIFRFMYKTVKSYIRYGNNTYSVFLDFDRLATRSNKFTCDVCLN